MIRYNYLEKDRGDFKMTATIISLSSFADKKEVATQNKVKNTVNLAMQGVLLALKSNGIDIQDEKVSPIVTLIYRFVTAAANEGLGIQDNLAETVKFFQEVTKLADFDKKD